MKRFLQLIFSAVIIGILCLVMSHWFKSKENTHTQEKIYVYNWGEYIDPSLIKSSKNKQAYKLYMKRLIQMKPWRPKYVMGVHIMMWHFK